jgi:hypothetical protein
MSIKAKSLGMLGLALCLMAPAAAVPATAAPTLDGLRMGSITDTLTAQPARVGVQLYFGAGPVFRDDRFSYRNRFFRGGDCRYLRRQALRTGSRYWWRRYRNCLAD